MTTSRTLRERHRGDRAAWLRAAVLGADDAIVSTASLMIGISASAAGKDAILVAGGAALVAGAMSMAVGEFVSVSSQRDTEQADIALERQELVDNPGHEIDELAAIYIGRGLSPTLAREVAEQLSHHDALGTHLRDELGIEPARLARPLQAAWVSAASFGSFALVPIGASLLAPAAWQVPVIGVVSLLCLTALGALGGHLGGAPKGRAALRVAIGGILAMGLTAGIGRLLGVAVG
ncbi:MAG TPA: VIT family protein [Myxococcota bacterium]